jgi:hypothetical protein
MLSKVRTPNFYPIRALDRSAAFQLECRPMIKPMISLNHICKDFPTIDLVTSRQHRVFFVYLVRGSRAQEVSATAREQGATYFMRVPVLGA